MDLRDELEASLGELYSIESELGGGGMSRVFLAKERSLGRRVVVKVLPKELTGGVNVDRFRREIVLAAQLQHPHIVTLLSTGQVAGVPYYTMPYEEGRSLRAHLREHGALPIGEVVGLLGDVAKALSFAHERGVIHRDIKPDNILVCGGAAVVSDFGIAKAVSDAKDQPPPHETGETLTQIGMSVGTPTYMAPEQAAADPDVDSRADIYSFGVTAYEMLTGRPPFCDSSPRKLLAAHLTEAPEPVIARRPDTPPALAAMVMACLAKEPADRPQTAKELARVLEIVQAGEQRAAREQGRRGSLVRQLALGLVALVAVSILARASIIAMGLPEWVLPAMLVAAVLIIVLLVGRAQGIARGITPMTPARRREYPPVHELDRIRLALAEAADRGEGAVLATVVGVDGSTYRGAGARMVVRADGATVGAVSGGCLEADIVARAAERLASGTPELVHYDTRASDDGVFGLGMGCQGVIDVRLEPLSGDLLRAEIERLAQLRERSAVRLLVCGAGNDAIPVVRLAALTGWLVTVVDHRPTFASTVRFPDAERVIRLDSSQPEGALASAVRLDTFTAAVVMGHAAAHDRARLHELLAVTTLRYIGVLGPRRRTLELLEGAPDVERGTIPPNVYAPVGLDIGAETPEEIALAIVSECSAVLAGRPPRSLRDRGGAIHEGSR